MRHHRVAAGPAMRRWLDTAFEAVPRSVEDIRNNYATLFSQVSEATGARFLILNRMSTSGQEDIATYAPFDAPLSSSLANVASKEYNLILDDFAELEMVDVIDVDAIAAAMGGGVHLPDGMHQSGPLQAAVRRRILEVLDALRKR